jgi:hypothetical protein
MGSVNRWREVSVVKIIKVEEAAPAVLTTKPA